LLFEPRLPTNDQFSNGGFRPGRTYLVQLVGGSAVNGTILRDTRGRPLEVPVSFRFNTANGAAASQLFRDTVLGGPRRVSLQVSPSADQSGAVQLNELGSNALEVRLRLDQPLNPSSTNVPVAIPSDPSLVGAVVGAQALSASPPLTLLGFIASNGVLLTVGVQ
jgi:hypothetical protein